MPSKNPPPFPSMPPIAGVQLAGVASGLKASGKPDLMLAVVPPGTVVAGTFTRSTCPSQPILWCRKIIGRHSGRAILVNSGNANAATGAAGWQVLEKSVDAVAKTLPCAREEVFIASTGIIGNLLAPDSIAERVPLVHRALGDDNWLAAARAIGTTDTYPKGGQRTAMIDGTPVQINGIVKGSGMIAPNMGTMLAFIFTDAAIAAPVLQPLLNRVVRDTFNSITVDGDTSTSDTALCFAVATAAHPLVTTPGKRLADFARALHEVCLELALQIVRDGEGATKLIETRVHGAKTRKQAHTIGLSIANSLLVRTALSHNVISWGRFMSAIGKTFLPVEQDRITIAIGDDLVAEGGHETANMNVAKIEEYLSGDHLIITIDLGLGCARHRVWSCDLTAGYITINNNRGGRT